MLKTEHESFLVVERSLQKKKIVIHGHQMPMKKNVLLRTIAFILKHLCS